LEAKKYGEMGDLGDENTSFFHAMATHCHNKISLAPFLCLMVFLLQLMIRKQAFYGKNAKKRLGVSKFSGISYNLSSFLQAQDLPNLDDDFSFDEIFL
jgi:hypothetical protein